MNLKCTRCSVASGIWAQCFCHNLYGNLDELHTQTFFRFSKLLCSGIIYIKDWFSTLDHAVRAVLPFNSIQLREWPFLAVLILITPQDSHVLLGRDAATMKNFDNYPNQIYYLFVCPQLWAGQDETQVRGLRSLPGKAPASSLHGKVYP